MDNYWQICASLRELLQPMAFRTFGRNGKFVLAETDNWCKKINYAEAVYTKRAGGIAPTRWLKGGTECDLLLGTFR